MASIEDDVKSIESQMELDVAKAVAHLHSELVRVAPVGNPSLWKVNQGRTGKLYYPKGYVGGFFKASWKFTHIEGMNWTIFNNAEYASLLWRGHSTQWVGGDALLAKANADLNVSFAMIEPKG